MDQLLNGLTADLRDEPAIVSLLESAHHVTDGDLTASVELVIVRLHQGRPCDEAVMESLGRAAALLALAEDQAAAHQRAETLRQRAQAALAHSGQLQERARAARRRADAARDSLETARKRMEAVSWSWVSAGQP